MNYSLEIIHFSVSQNEIFLFALYVRDVIVTCAKGKKNGSTNFLPDFEINAVFCITFILQLLLYFFITIVKLSM